MENNTSSFEVQIDGLFAGKPIDGKLYSCV